MAFTLTEISVLLTFAYFAFGIRCTGNPLALGAVILLGATTFAGLGLLIASRAKTIETVSGLMNAIMLPMYVLSGVFFPSDRFPDAVQPFIQILPLTAVNDALRAVMNEGKGFEAILLPVAVLAAWGAVSFALALKLFRWR
jgi:ABC-type multidrug transport system permease subunit